MKRCIFPLALFISGCIPVAAVGSLDARCALRPETGHCRAAFPRYYFDAASGSCKEFIWGGCGGVVPFETLGDCVETCGPDMHGRSPARQVPGTPVP